MSKEVGDGGRFDIFLDSVWSFPFSSNVHVRNVRTQTIFAMKRLRQV